MKSLAVVVPCFNESKRFSVSYWNQMLATLPEVKWLFVDDGSTDSTKDMLSNFCAEHGGSVLALNQNQGKGNAIRLGFKELVNADQEVSYLGYLDSDGAFSIPDVQRLILLSIQKDEVGGNFPWDVFISSRVAMAGRKINRKIARHYLGRVIATYLTQGWKGAPYDSQSGFKIFRLNQSLNDALEDTFKTRWFVDLELISRLEMGTSNSLRIWEEPLNFWTDVDGSKIHLRHMFSIIKEARFVRKQVKNFLRIKRSLTWT
jgi:glycosyltransferase involved in cell wall biosynthesis